MQTIYVTGMGSRQLTGCHPCKLSKQGNQKGQKVLSGHPDRDHEQGDSNNNDTVTLNKHTTTSGQNSMTTSADLASCREKEDGLEKRVPGILLDASGTPLIYKVYK